MKAISVMFRGSVNVVHIYTGPSDASLSSICTTPHHLFSLCFSGSIPRGRWNLQVYFYGDDTLHLLSPFAGLHEKTHMCRTASGPWCIRGSKSQRKELSCFST